MSATHQLTQSLTRTRARRWVVVVAVGTLLAVGTAALATLVADDRPLLTFLVYLLVVGPVFFSGALVLLPDPAREDPVTHQEDTVEHAWAESASAGAFVDLMVVAGLATAAQYALDLPAVPLVVVSVVGMVSFAVRYAMISRRAG